MAKLLESQKLLQSQEVALAQELGKIKDFVKKTGAKF